jgi:hypothetical protein
MSTTAATKPTMGNLTPSGTPFTGGIPKHDWSGLVTVSPIPLSPHQVRSQSESEQNKDWTRRTTPAAILLSKDDPKQSLFQFASVVYKHAEGVGCDTIFYCPSIIDPTVMICVLNQFEQVTLDHVVTEVTTLLPKWDIYDKGNDLSMKNYLLKSISPTLAEDIEMEMSLQGDTASILWMRIVRKVLDGSMARFEKKKEELKGLSPLKEPGQNVSLYCIKVRRILNELWQARQFDWTLILHIVSAFSEVTVPQFFATTYCFMLPIADAKIKSIQHMTLDAANRILLATPIHWIKLLSDAEDMYSSYVSQGKWPPAKSPKDSGSPQAHLLKQGAGGATKTKGVCHICKSPDHWANKCPQKGQQTKGADAATPGTVPPVVPPATDAKTKPPHWKHIPPTDGQQTKSKNGKTYHWCANCFKAKGQWTISHTTATHTGKVEDTTPQPAVPQPAVNLFADLSQYSQASWSPF